MASFLAVMIDGNGSRSRRVIQASDLAGARALARQNAMILVAVRQLGLAGWLINAAQQQRHAIGPERLQRFNHMLAAYLKAGIPVQDSLRLLGESTPELAPFAMTVRQNLADGHSLHAALQEAGFRLPPGFLSLVRAGMESGKLDQILENESRRAMMLIEIRRDLWSALIYPLVLISMSIVVILFMLGSIVPQIRAGMPAEAIERAPAISRVIFAASDFLHAMATPQGFAALIAMAAAIAVAIAARWQGFVSLMTAAPGFGPITRSLRAATFAQSLGMMLESGVRLETAWRLAVESVQDPASRAALGQAGARILQGHSMSDAIAQSMTMPADVVSTFALGERTGTLPHLLRDVAALHAGEALARLRKISGIVVPAIILLSGLIVGSFAAAMMATIQSVNQIYGG